MAFSDREPILRTQLPVFADGIAANISLYQVTQPDSDAISAAVNEFVDKYEIWNNPATRNVDSLNDKNAAKASALGICRVFYRQIQINNGIDDGAKEVIFVTPLSNTRTPRPCPVSPPTLSVVAATNGAQTLLYGDPLDPEARRKPEGADGIVLFRAIAATPVTDPAQFHFYRKYTTRPMPVFFDEADRGKIASYYAKWIGQRGDMSTPSATVSMAIAA
jgi:hypothetical protein